MPNGERLGLPNGMVSFPSLERNIYADKVPGAGAGTGKAALFCVVVLEGINNARFLRGRTPIR